MNVGRAPGIELCGTGVAPRSGGRVVGNDEVDAVVAANGGEPISRAWLERSGYWRRWWTAEPGGSRFEDAPTTEDLMVTATQAALDDARIRPADVDVLVACTTTPTRMTSAVATAVAGRLGITGAAMDLRAGCPSALHGLVTAYGLLALGARTGVVVAAETLSGVAPGSGPLAYAVGDGAAAAVLRRCADTERGLLGGVLATDGSASRLVGTPGALPPTRADLDADRYRLIMTREYDAVARPVWSKVGPAVLDRTSVSPETIGAVVANQAGALQLGEAATASGVPAGATVDLVGTTANAGAASFMIALDEARRREHDGGRPWLLIGVGGGLSWGGVVIRP